jgi:hypothetical protein
MAAEQFLLNWMGRPQKPLDTTTEIYKLGIRASQGMIDLGYINVSTIIPDVGKIIYIFRNQYDSSTYPFSSLDLSLGGNLPNNTIKTQADLDNLLTHSINSTTTNFEKFILYSIALMGMGYMNFFLINNSIINYDIDNPSLCFPPYYRDFTASTQKIIEVFNELIILSSNGLFTISNINAELNTVNLDPLPDAISMDAAHFNLYSLSPPPPSLTNFYKLILMGFYYYAWMGKYIHQI